MRRILKSITLNYYISCKNYFFSYLNELALCFIDDPLELVNVHWPLRNGFILSVLTEPNHLTEPVNRRARSWKRIKISEQLMFF